ncbi:MAG TPA: DNA polymerase sliding clamp [Thermoplasmatales archaeon]|nr:DNA polymerase sliding clamp [Candidatus Thermoplasmatota archaeon]MDD5778730.1 DNA polymerase sliding clamp [Candidatus Thermoplasmatota archaeon]HDS58696.1 DNA polymerase sliding clamp [Thermoplasmatales archaeon]
MFQVTIKTDYLRNIVDATSILVDEIKLHFTPDQVYARAVDPAHVGMVDFKLKSEAFEEYDVKEDVDLAVDLDKLKSMLKLPSTEEVISLIYEEEGQLVVHMGNLTRHMSLLDTADMADTKIPSLELSTEIVVKTAEVYKGVKASEAVSDHIALSANPEGFELTAQGDTDTVSLHISKDQLVSLKCKEQVRSLFSLDYFSDMVKSVKSESLKIYLGNDYPVKMLFELAGDHGEVAYLLAPRIESE